MTPTLDGVLSGLRAAGESTRLRLLWLCAQGEFTVTELCQMLGQSQPRISRHLKLLCEAGLLERYQERTWVFYRLTHRQGGAALARTLVGLLPGDDPTLALDRERLEAVRLARAAAAARYFGENVARWDRIRALYVPEVEVEAALTRLFDGAEIGDLLDIGTGTGRVLEVLAPRVAHGIGIDLSHEMLAAARVNLERAGLTHCHVRYGDMYSLPFPSASFDAVTVYMVLHYADNPVAALAEAARVLRPHGRLAVVDFAPHEQEFLRSQHAHRRLGFAEGEVLSWYRSIGLEAGEAVRLPGDPLTVVLWPARRSGVAARVPAREPAAAGTT